MHPRVAVVLLNLGGPSDLDSVEQFLFSLFYDPAIITLPKPLRWLLAKLISIRRKKQSQHLYSLIGGRSPILEETQKQRMALLSALKNISDYSFEVFICMRHSSPKSFEVAQQIAEYKPEQVVLLPLYPQFSTTTTASAVKDLLVAMGNSYRGKIKTVCCYPNNYNFIASHLELIKSRLDKYKPEDCRIIFSAHGLPVKTIKGGDPYQWQVEKTVESLMQQLSDYDHVLAYQSRVGPLEWLKPNTEDEIKKAGAEGKEIILVPIAFVSEHVETLVELDIEYRQIAEQYKIEYVRIPALGIQPLFIKGLQDLIINALNSDKTVISGNESGLKCPKDYCKCINAN